MEPGSAENLQGRDSEQGRVTILGGTGSIGASTLDLIARNPNSYRVSALTAHRNAAELAELAIRHSADLAVIADPEKYPELRDLLSGSGVKAAAGREALCEAASLPADCVVAGIVGAAGLAPTLAAAKAGRRIALANKECLVAAGSVFKAAVRSGGGDLIPIDSEHSAVFQVLHGQDRGALEKITLTASGGPFRTFDVEQLAVVTPAQAVKHPNWSMGQKISVDSATLMNKGLELIEAHFLFDVPPDMLAAVVHPQSIVHCLVSYRDGSVLAQMAAPDMRTPIAIGLSWPKRMAAPTERLDLAAVGSLTFESPDFSRFPALSLAFAAMRAGGGAPAILNAANEVAVECFLNERIGFLDIAKIVEKALDVGESRGLFAQPDSLEAVLALDGEVRELARSMIE